jgi:hypothetical protein
MRRSVVLVLVGVLLVGACGGGEDGASETSAASTTERRGEPVVIRTSVAIAATPGAEPIAIGEVLEGPPSGDRRSALAGPSWIPTGAPIPPWSRTALWTGRSLAGRHREAGLHAGRAAGPDPDGFVDDRQRHRCLRGLRGSGEMEVSYDPDDNALARETFTGTVTR